MIMPTFTPAATLQAQAEAYAAAAIAPIEADLAQSRTDYAALLAKYAGVTAPSRPSYGSPGGRSYIDTPAKLAELSGRSILGRLDIRVAGAIDDFEIDITAGGVAPTTPSYAIAAVPPEGSALLLSRGRISAVKPSINAFGIVGSGLVTRSLDISGVVDGVNIMGGTWTDYGSWIHGLNQTPPSHADAAAANQSGEWRLYGTILDAGLYAGASSLSCIMVSPGPLAGLYGYGITLLGGYPAINIRNTLAPFPFDLVDSLIGPQTFPGGAAIIAPAAMHPTIQAGLKNTRMIDGSPVKLARG